jgi:glycosyltransferase involved in cell wall biosynthesis
MRRLPFDRANRVPLGNQAVHFLFVGRWERVKGVDILLEAVKLAVKAMGHEAFEAILVGGGVMETELREFIRENDLEKVIRVVKQPPFPDLLGYFQEASCVIIPSRSESIPLVFGEALQANAPLIVSDVGDMGYLAREYDLGRVVAPENIEGLAEAMEEFVKYGFEAGSRRAELVRQLDLSASARVLGEQMEAALN